MQKSARTFDVSCEALRHLLDGDELGNTGVRGKPSLVVVGDGVRLPNVWPCNNGSQVSPGCRRVPMLEFRVPSWRAAGQVWGAIKADDVVLGDLMLVLML